MMKRDINKKKPALNADDYPQLQEFFAGYLHQDFHDEYGSALQAATAYCRDADLEQTAEARREWTKLRKNLAGQPVLEWQKVLRKLGSSWLPQTKDDLLDMDKVLSADA